MEVWRVSEEGVEVVIVNPGVILGSGYWKTGSGKLFHQVFNGFNYYSEGITGFVDPMEKLTNGLEQGILNQKPENIFLIKATYRFVL